MYQSRNFSESKIKRFHKMIEYLIYATLNFSYLKKLYFKHIIIYYQAGYIFRGTWVYRAGKPRWGPW